MKFLVFLSKTYVLDVTLSDMALFAGPHILIINYFVFTVAHFLKG
jgi:hypothetical protein